MISLFSSDLIRLEIDSSHSDCFRLCVTIFLYDSFTSVRSHLIDYFDRLTPDYCSVDQLSDNNLQQNIDLKYHDSNDLRENLIRACRNHFAFVVELHNSSLNSSTFFDSFCINIVNWKTINKSTKHTYFQNIDNLFHDQCFTNRQYRREFFNNRDNDWFSFNSRFRDKFSICAFKNILCMW